MNNNKEERLKKINWVKLKLEEVFGEIENTHERTPLDTLIQTILSQNTNDDNRDKAEESLWKKFDDYEEMADASTSEIAESIKTAGLQNQKAKAIKGVLTELGQNGDLNLNHIKDLAAEEAWKELMEFDGVGKKTAAVVALFSLDKPIFPVDTHVRRVTSRLGIVKSGENHHETLTELVAAEDMYQFHLHLIRHGRETCKSRKPLCSNCVLLERCPTGEENLEEG